MRASNHSMHTPPLPLPILSVGCLAGFMLKDMSGIQGFVAGGFIYIATVDIIPVMLQDSGFGWPLIFEILAMTRQSPLSSIPLLELADSAVHFRRTRSRHC